MRQKETRDFSGGAGLFEFHYPARLRQAEAKLIAQRRKALQRPEAPAGNAPAKSAPAEKTEDAIEADVGTEKDDRVGFALSGGGIRSATFCLGVFQALADEDHLHRVDYLSTVSGGGYFGSFLGRLFTREWIKTGDEQAQPDDGAKIQAGSPPSDRVRDQLRRRQSWTMRYLRNNGRYLSPNRAGDLWLAISMFLRNWVAVFVVLWVFIFSLFALLAFLRVWFWPWSWEAEAWLAERSTGSLWWSPVLFLMPIPLLFILSSGIAYWFSLETWSNCSDSLIRRIHRRISRLIPLAVIGMAALAWAFLEETASVSILVMLLMISAYFQWYWFRGAIGKFESREKREKSEKVADSYIVRNRLARRAASGLYVSTLLFLIAFVDSLAQSAYAVSELLEGMEESQPFAEVLGGLLGIATAAASAKWLYGLIEHFQKAPLVRVPAIVLAIFAGCALALLYAFSASFAAHTLLWAAEEPVVRISAEEAIRPGAALMSANKTLTDHRQWKLPRIRPLRDSTPEPKMGRVLPAFVGAVIFSWLIGRTFGFFNLSSLHSFYAARLARTYLGASNSKRFEGEKKDVGTPIEDDDCSWLSYKPWETGGPLHLVNQTLNETVEGRSQIEYRDRKGMIFCHGPAGLSVGSEDHGLWTSGDEVPERSQRQRQGWENRYLVPLEPLNVKHRKFHALGLRSRRVTEVEHCSLGRHVAISGAAFTTGVGYRTHIGTSLLAGLLNIRMGYWWTINLRRRDRVKEGTVNELPFFERWLHRVFPVQAKILSELTARFHGPAEQRWYLSDGEHFENTGAFELIRRRIPFIVVCDCGQDRVYGFRDVSNLARQVRVDLGADLEILDNKELERLHVPESVREYLGTPTDFVRPVTRNPEEKRAPILTAKHGLLARVRYEQEDGRPARERGDDGQDSPPGCSYVLFLKPSVTGDEPQDVLHYHARRPDFPHEPTYDQYFDEAQWESYRQLGVHIGRLFFPSFLNLKALARRGRR